MDSEQPDDKGKRNREKSRLDKILSQPGVWDAIDLTRSCAWERAVDEAIEQGVRGEFGDELKVILESEETDALERFVEHEPVCLSISDNFEDLLLEFAVRAGPKIAELWGFSEGGGELISRVIYSGMDWKSTEREELYTPLTMLVSTKDVENNKNFAKRYREVEERGIKVGASDRVPKGRTFLDVTEITNQRLRSIYKAIELCRQILKIRHEDLRVGAPKSFDTGKALEADLLRRIGKSNKEIVRQLGFKIYENDYLENTAPHLYKYLKLGKEMDERLSNLESYLSSLHPNDE